MKIDHEKYDRFIWRANGTLLLLLCFIGVISFVSLGISVLSTALRPREVHDVINIDQTTKKEEYVRLGFFQNLKGTDLLLIPLTFEQKIDMTFYSKSTKTSARNYLLFNNLTKENFWIWKSSQLMILENEMVYDQISDEKNQKVVGIIFERVEKDSNSDGVLNEKDTKIEEYFDLASNKLITFHQGFDQSLGIQKNSNNEILHFYMRGGKNYFRTLVISTLTVSEEKEIPLQL